MAKKTFTFLVTSNRKGKTQSLTLSASILKIGLGVMVFIAVTLTAMFVDYVGLLLESGENKRLKAENASLKKQFEVVEHKVNSLENSLERVKSFSTKLKLITDVDSDDRTINLALGASSLSTQQAVAQEQKGSPENRNPASTDNLDDDDIDSFREQVTNLNKGEILKLDMKNYATLSIRVDQALESSKLKEQGIIDLYKNLSDQSSLLKATPTIAPTKGWFSAKFGYHRDPFSGKPVMHNGVDIAAAEGTPVWAPADGKVEHIGYENNLGKVVTIDHGFGLKTRYAHASQIYVELGQKVSRKDQIAAVGNTGRSQAPHLYYEVRVHGIPVDPTSYIIE